MMTRSAYTRLMSRLLRNAATIEKENAASLRAELQRVRKLLIGAVAERSGFERARTQLALDEINAMLSTGQVSYEQVVSGSYLKSYTIGAQIGDTAAQVARDRDPSVLPPVFDARDVAIAKTYSVEMAKGVFGEAKERLNRIVRNGLLLQESPQVIMRSMAKVLRDKTEPELLRIYRTEFSHALNLGTQARGQAAVDDGAELYKYWLATKDSRTRDSHRAVNDATNPEAGGTPIKFSENYYVGGHSASGPHDAGLPPEEVINCRCRSILIPQNVL